ncbi:MAG: metallophosphoesterase [Deltaproteobacteria bacterium]|nr:metallophosphoesterase [Deltaproteobacteria bacterium]
MIGPRINHVPAIVSLVALLALACGDTKPNGSQTTPTPPDRPAADAGSLPPPAVIPDPPATTDAGTPVVDAGDDDQVPDGGRITLPDAGGPVTYQGGTVDLMKFTVFGDIRPAIFEFDNQYPDDIVRAIATQMNATGAQFAVGVGDYMFSFSERSVNTQLDKLLAAERPFTKPIFHAMGNHECWGPTGVNCPNYNETPNVRLFLSRLFSFSQRPWYDFTVTTSKGDAKFVLIAQNSWNDQQKQWLETTLARPSTYTFIVRHQPSGTWTTPGLDECDRIVAAHPYTLLLVGHVHRYEKIRANTVMAGHGGAPLEGGDFGYVLVEQQATGLLKIESRKKGDDSIVEAWKVDATGTEIP